MNIVITGGTGFIGQAVADLYIKAGHHVFVTGHEAPVPGADYLGRDFQAVDWSKLPTIDILNHQVAIAVATNIPGESSATPGDANTEETGRKAKCGSTWRS